MVERAIQTLKNLIIANPEDKIELNENINRVWRIVRFTIHTGLKVSPFELHHGRKPTTELTKIIKRNKSYLSDWTTLSILVPPKYIPIYVARNKKSEATDHIIMAKNTKTPCCASHRLPKRRPVKPVSENFQYPYTFFEKRKLGKLLEAKYKEQRRIAIDGTKHTVRTADKKFFTEN